ncbi:MAG: phosphomannomutase/phosphoglucomutase [Phycisphaeraceae bacterium]|nr:phosphomannomutase/phosphoglucomutase [Phycisphaeraceae bacterium]
MIGKIFKAYDVRATYPNPLDEKAAWKVGYATGQFLVRASGQAKAGTVLVSRDMRPHSPSLCAALVEGLRAAGPSVIDLGMCDTSFMYFAINQQNAIGGIQTTASHNPVNYNGFKISGREARPIGADTGLKDIQKTVESLPENIGPGALAATGKYQQMDLWEAYREHILKFLSPLKRPLKVVIDASNGMAGKLVPAVFREIPNLEIIPINFEITGSFVHEPNPLVAENMKPTQDGVRQHKADLGACFDGDADRCMLTDDQGQIIGCDHLTALLCNHFLSLSPHATVIYDLRSSKVVSEQIQALGGTPRRSRVGHVFMKALLRETQGVFGGELSGHFYFRDNFYADSGAIAFAAVLSVLAASRRPLSELIEPFRKYPQSGEINFHVEDKAAVLKALKDRYAAGAEIDELDGVTIDAFAKQGWWFNVRASNTEPLLRLNAEARDQGGLDKLLGEIKPMLGTPVEGH